MKTPVEVRQMKVPQVNPQIQVSSIFDGQYDIVLRPREDRAELQSRMRILEANATCERRKDAVLFGVLLVSILLVVGVCVAILISPRSSAISQNWATGVLASLAVGVSGYLFGRAGSKSRGA